MSIYSPEKNWLKAPHGAEKAWLALAILWCIVLTLAMPYWHFKGKQNSTGEAYRVKPADFVKRVDQFIEANKVGEEEVKTAGGMKMEPVVQPAPGAHVYLLAGQWYWKPKILKLKLNQEYKLHISSADVQHGFSLLPINMNFQIQPGYDHVLTITPTKPGLFQVICNEFCGRFHDTMTAKIVVE